MAIQCIECHAALKRIGTGTWPGGGSDWLCPACTRAARGTEKFIKKMMAAKKPENKVEPVKVP